MIIKIWLIAFLGICAITDLAERHVYTMFCFANGLIIAIMQFFIRDKDFMSCLLGGLIGIICLFVCIVSKESMGKGDALIIGIIGIAIGFQDTLEVLAWSFLIIVIIAIYGIWKRQLKLQSKIPLIPFIVIGTIIQFCVRG